MTKPLPEAVALRKKIENEGPLWPADVLTAGVVLRCELDCARLRGWEENGGPQRLAQYLDDFDQRYSKLKNDASPNE